MASIYIMDGYQYRELCELVQAATTLEELKRAVVKILASLPVEYDS